MAEQVDFMKMAIEEGRRSVAEPDRTEPTPRVGAVLVRDGKAIARCHRGKTGPGDHAEYGLLRDFLAKGEDLSDCELYVTLEPCTLRGPGKTPCVRHIQESHIHRVYIGSLDPNRTIQGDGVQILCESGIDVSLFPSELMRDIHDDNRAFMNAHRPERWLPPVELRRLDDWYHIINGIFQDKNLDKDPMWFVGHLVELITGLSLLGTRKIKPEFSMENYLPKTITWWLALCGSVGCRSVEELIWMKFPGVCPYCQSSVHDDAACRRAKRESRNPRWDELRNIGARAWKADAAPKTLVEWQKMFNTIYPIVQTEDYGITFGRLSEELGELAEAVRMYGMAPATFVSEAADVFAWLMHLVGLYEAKADTDLDLNRLMYRKYPDRCRDCDQPVCKCPPHLSRTLRRLSHDGPRYLEQEEFFLSPSERLQRFSLGDKEVKIGDRSIGVSAETIQAVYEWAQATTENLRAVGVASPQFKILHRLISNLQAMAAIQRVGQASLDKLIMFIQSLNDEEYQRMREAIPETKSEFATAIVEFMAFELERRVRSTD